MPFRYFPIRNSRTHAKPDVDYWGWQFELSLSDLGATYRSIRGRSGAGLEIGLGFPTQEALDEAWDRMSIWRDPPETHGLRFNEWKLLTSAEGVVR
jgi:hypothetical protein